MEESQSQSKSKSKSRLQSQSQQQDGISSEDWARPSYDPAHGQKVHEGHGLDTGVRVMGMLSLNISNTAMLSRSTD